MSEQRFIDIETKIAHQDYQIDELHQVIYEQRKIIDRLETLLQGLSKRFTEVLGAEGSDIRGNEKPPHY